MMRVVLHQKVHSDVDAIMDYYGAVASHELADDLYADLRQCITDAAERPESYAVRKHDLRRVTCIDFRITFCPASLVRRRAHPRCPASSQTSVVRPLPPLK